MPPSYSMCLGFCSYHTFILPEEYPLHSSLYSWCDEEFISPSDYHQYQMAHETRLRGKKEPQLMSPREKTGEREQGAKTSKWKSFTCHEASGSWSLHSTMSCIKLCMHGVRVTGRCQKTSVVMSPECFFLKRDEVAGFMQPKQCFLVPESLWRAAPLVHRILSSECLIQLASQ